MDTDGFASELALEQEAVERIVDAHRAHVASSRRYATGLADEASFLSEEGPRETEAESGDEDGESAAEAATARAASARAVLAWKRVRELEGAGSSLAFGRISSADGHADYIGRMSVVDGDEALLIDWRARAAEPFYRATPLEPLGVTHRRHLHYTDDAVTNYSDEVFDTASIDEHTALRGEAALLAALAERTDDRMQSVVSTIQAEQDAVVRASSRGPLLVQGGPGTGKTVVALHRAAYLLYADRAALAETGVLIVGPSNEFLTYISDVLPSLGESGVVSVTAERLYPGIRLSLDLGNEVATLKGDIAMVKLLATAVSDRQRTPVEPLAAWYGSRRVRVPLDFLQRFFATAQRQATHNSGAGVFGRLIFDHLVEEIYEPGFGSRHDVRVGLKESTEIGAFLDRHWPVLSPEQALNDLFGSTGLLASAARAAGLTDDQQTLLHQTRTRESDLARRVWCHADVPLLDELLHLLGDPTEADDVEFDMEHTVADEVDVFTLAEQEDESEDDEYIDVEESDEVEHYDAWSEGDEESTWR